MIRDIFERAIATIAIYLRRAVCASRNNEIKPTIAVEIGKRGSSSGNTGRDEDSFKCAVAAVMEQQVWARREPLTEYHVEVSPAVTIIVADRDIAADSREVCVYTGLRAD